MPAADLPAITLWAIGLVFVIVAILTTIARVFRYRYSGTFDPPWIRGGVAFFVGLACISGSLYLLGVRDGLIRFWQYALAIAIAGVVVALWRRWR